MDERGIFQGDVELTLASGAINTPRGWLWPDDTKAYVEAYVSHSYPAIFAFGTCLHPQTIGNSFMSLQDQNVNRSHLIRAYDKENISRDSIIGSVVSSEYPPSPDGGWRMTNGTPPGIRCIMTIFKQASGVDKILGTQQAGRKKWSVSIEYNYATAESGFLISNMGLKGGNEIMNFSDTPSDIMNLGMWYVPWAKAPADLQACWDKKKGVMKGQWKGAKTILMQGGIGGKISYIGIALTEYPAEPTARIDQVLAEDKPDDKVNPMLLPIHSILKSAVDYNNKVLARLE